jgi:hypothetical protein
VPYVKGGEIVRTADMKSFKIHVQRPSS